MTDKVIWMFYATQDRFMDFEDESEDLESEDEALESAPLEYLLTDRFSLLYSLYPIPMPPATTMVVAIEKDLIPELGSNLPQPRDQEILTVNTRGEFVNYAIEDFTLEFRLDEAEIEAVLNEDAVFINDTAGLGFLWLSRNFPSISMDIH